MSLPPILNRALKAAYIGANEIIHSSKRIQNIQITKKEGNDITTNIDLLVQEKVFDELQKHYPDFSYLGEESNEHISQEEENIWILDPIDGTKNFAKQYPHYALSLACLKNKEVICAVVIDPVRDEVFCAAEGTGALLNNRRIRHSNKKLYKMPFSQTLAIMRKMLIIITLSWIQLVNSHLRALLSAGLDALHLIFVTLPLEGLMDSGVMVSKFGIELQVFILHNQQDV